VNPPEDASVRKDTEAPLERKEGKVASESVHQSGANDAPGEDIPTEEAGNGPNRIKKMKLERSGDQQQERKRNRNRATQPPKNKI